MAEEAEAPNVFNLPIVKQMMMLIGMAVSIAMGVGLVLWLQKPDFGVLYPALDGQDAAEVAESLTQHGIPYTIQAATGAIMVPKSDIQMAKLKLASEGLPQSTSHGYEMLQKGSEFGTSQFMELARFRRALENELARTISSMQSIKSARVHLAIPKEPVFVRDRRKSSASVFIDLFSGRSLSKAQVDAIVNMVASSIPEMQTDDVTVVDDKGRLLTGGDVEDSFAITAKQLDIKQRIEKEYMSRIDNLLAPIVGSKRVRSQVSVDVDFTRHEETQEAYDPDKEAIRSAQYIQVEPGEDGQLAQGIPGALSNVPANQPEGEEGAEGENKKAIRLKSTENFEIDKTISYKKKQPWEIERLSIAVAVDDVVSKNQQGEVVREPVSEEEIERLTQLVKNAVGFTQARGDVVEVINVSFVEPEKIAAIPPLSMFEQPWFSQVVKYIAGGIGLLVIIFGVIRPILNHAMKPEQQASAGGPSMSDLALGGDLASEALQGTGESAMPKLPEPGNAYGARMESVRNMVREHPGRVAEVVMDWVGDENE